MPSFLNTSTEQLQLPLNKRPYNTDKQYDQRKDAKSKDNAGEKTEKSKRSELPQLNRFVQLN